jgi:hypothetical protein
VELMLPLPQALKDLLALTLLMITSAFLSALRMRRRDKTSALGVSKMVLSPNREPANV